MLRAVSSTSAHSDRSSATYISIALVGILAVFLFTLEFGAGPYRTVHGPLSRIGCESEWRVMIGLGLDAALILLLLDSDSRPFRSSTLQTLTCALNC
jgi:hypothetical protein